MLKNIQTSLLTGVLILVPFIATIKILKWLILTVNNLATEHLPESMVQKYPLIGIVFVLAAIVILGALAQNFIGQYLVNLLDHGVRKLPFVGGIYGTIKKFLENFVQPGGDKFHGVVLIQFPRNGVYSIGFRTGKPDSHLIPKSFLTEGKKITNVFIPCTPNPTSGFYLLVDESELVPLDISVQEAFKIVVSMGIVTTDETPEGK